MTQYRHGAIKLLFHKAVWSRDIEFRLGRYFEGTPGECGEWFIAIPANDIEAGSPLHYQKNGNGILGATGRLSIEDAQDIVDQLWQCGIRPSEAMGIAGALSATERHLDDLRKIVFQRDSQQ